MHKTTTVLGMVTIVALAGALGACSSTPPAPSPQAGSTSAAPTSISPKQVSVTLAKPTASGAQPPGLTYAPALAPVGAKVTVEDDTTDDGTEIKLTVSGLLPEHQYGAHVHTRPCGAKAADAGPHYQNLKDTVNPSVDPAFANATNEIWLDFTTDATGAADTTATVSWRFRTGEANATVIHATHTMTEAGKAGTAGDRLACVTTAF
jgi:Cu-Zn family superoxide dismutase